MKMSLGSFSSNSNAGNTVVCPSNAVITKFAGFENTEICGACFVLNLLPGSKHDEWENNFSSPTFWFWNTRFSRRILTAACQSSVHTTVTRPLIGAFCMKSFTVNACSHHHILILFRRLKYIRLSKPKRTKNKNVCVYHWKATYPKCSSSGGNSIKSSESLGDSITNK